MLKTFAMLVLALCCSLVSLPEAQASAPDGGGRSAEMRRRGRVVKGKPRVVRGGRGGRGRGPVKVRR